MKNIAQKNRLKIIIAILVLVVVAGQGYWMYEQNIKTDFTDVDDTRAAIEKHMLLPTNETPALLTVTDPAKVNVPFLKKSQKGDVVLIYQIAKKAIIYRPSVDRIVDVGPVILDTPKGGSNPQ